MAFYYLSITFSSSLIATLHTKAFWQNELEQWLIFFRVGAPTRKRPATEEGQAYSRYGNGDSSGYSRRPNKRSKAYPKSNPDDCFLCAGKPEFRQDLVVSIGEESIVSTLRGPLPKAESFPELSASGHAMIIPLYHAANEAAEGQRPAEDVDREFEEMSKYRRALGKMIGNKSQAKLGAVCWEVNRMGIRHHHW